MLLYTLVGVMYVVYCQCVVAKVAGWLVSYVTRFRDKYFKRLVGLLCRWSTTSSFS